MNVQELIEANKGTIVDVRTLGEFQGGHVAGSKNIPLGEVAARVDEFKTMEAPVILCCASGNRSGQATAFLSAQGVECVNGGSWLDVNFYQSQCTSN
ncbi:rhodanese-like domain-containing protein [Jiulongibacter sp. NS-SX5]|uniref:rhodanese-like domain-containing protein n=1 Tax=Jiulongibacter sp. NS-SX5 TaxID=3463854 RepID=UPI004057D282